MKIDLTAVSICSTILLGSCAGPLKDAGIGKNDSRISAKASDAEKTAMLLSRADEFASDDNMTALADALYALEALGAKQLDADKEDLGGADNDRNDKQNDRVETWRKLASVELKKLPPFRGLVLGPAYTSGRLAPGQGITIGQVFLGGTTANIALSASTNSFLNMTVTGGKNAMVCDHRPIGKKACKWVPLFTERYSIKIRNVGRKPVQYYLAVD